MCPLIPFILAATLAGIIAMVAGVRGLFRKATRQRRRRRNPTQPGSWRDAT
jgi:hypothetical protein